MIPTLQITSAQNSRIKLVHRLRSKRGRESEARFLIDYERDLLRAICCRYVVDFLLHCPEIASAPVTHNVDAHQVSPQLMQRISYRENPSGILAVMHSKPVNGLSDLKTTEITHAAVLVNLRVPGNIGALLRTADAAGIDAVILVDTALDLYNPNIIRSSTGACFRDNIFELSSEEAISYFKHNGFQIYASDVGGAASIFELDYRGKVAIALGSEDHGLSQAWIDQSDRLVHIPMSGSLSDSLNVSVSGAIFMYELFRQQHACSHSAER